MARAAPPGFAPARRTALQLEALYALAYLHTRDDEAARRAVGGALDTLRLDLAAGASISGLAGTAGVWRALANQLHAGYAVGVKEDGDGEVNTARPALTALRREAIALHAGGCTDSHAAGLLGLARPVIVRLRRAR